MKLLVRIFAGFLLLISCTHSLQSQDLPQGITIDKILYRDDFNSGLEKWVVEQTPDGKVSNAGINEKVGYLEIDGGGTTVWFKDILNGPVLIEYYAILISEGGPNDNCRDLNCFWMARHPRAPFDLFTGWRSNSLSRAGVFSSYNELRTYYAGIGGHKNTTTRFRRYTGHGEKPLLPEHDIPECKFSLEPNRFYKIQIMAFDHHIRVWADEEMLFDFYDPAPYTSGWFGFRTVSNHMKVDNFTVYRLSGKLPADPDNEFEYAEKLGINKGLTEKSTRKGWKVPFPPEEDSHTYASERTIFYDPETRGLIWQMSSDPAVESNEYTDIPVWSANGEYMLFRTLRNGNAERWLMKADGTALQPVSGPHQTDFEKGFWSILYPGVLYYTRIIEKDESVFTRLLTFNAETGEENIIADYPGNLGVLQPPHPSEDLFLFGDHMKGAWEDKEHPSKAFVVNKKEVLHVIEFEKLFHRLRFTKSPEGDIFFNFDQPRQSFTCKKDGSDRIEIPFNGGHPDWVPGGRMLFFNAREVLPDGTKNFDLRYDAVDADGSNLRTIYPYGGHASACLDGRYFVCDGGEGAGSVNYVSLYDPEFAQNLFMNQTSRYDHTNKWHPDHHSTHPHPNSSPDGTKVISNSDVSGEFSDLFVSVSRLPDPPLNPRLFRKGKQVCLTWSPPARSRETEGYFIYATSAGPDSFKLFVPGLVRDTLIPVKEGRNMGFQIVAKEYSGLISSPSATVWESSGDAETHFIILEAEDPAEGENYRKMINMEETSTGYYALSKEDAHLIYNLKIPEEREYVLWARLKKRGEWQVTLNGTRAGSMQGIEENWIWEKLRSGVLLKKGFNSLDLHCPDANVMIDKIILVTDKKYYPKGKAQTDSDPPKPPAFAEIEQGTSNNVRIGWEGSTDPDISYYQVYAGRNPDFPLNQRHRVGSPAETSFTDQRLSPGETYYYKITSVDIWNNESTGFSECIYTCPPIFRAEVKLLPGEATSRNFESVYSGQTGEKYLRSTDEKNAWLEWEFEIPVDGSYAIWGQSLAKDLEISIFDIEIDGMVITEWEAFGLYDTWKYSPLGSKSSGTPELFPFVAGKHTLRINARKKGDCVGNIILTNSPDREFFPEWKSTGY